MFGTLVPALSIQALPAMPPSRRLLPTYFEDS